MINRFVLKHIKMIEVIGVIMRIISFSLVSWLGSKSPFLFVWGVVGILRAAGII